MSFKIFNSENRPTESEKKDIIDLRNELWCF